jgi:hypothetical protein
VVVGTGVAREPFHVHPEKNGAAAGAHRLERLHAGVVDLLDIAAVDFQPVVRLEDVERARIDFAGRAADAVLVVLDDEEHRQLPLFRETDRFEEIALARCRVADRSDHNVRFFIELDAPRDAARGQKLRAGRRRDAPNSSRRVTVMRRHLAAVTLAFALRKIIERQLARRDPAPEHERAVAVIRHDEIALDHRDPERRQTLVPHSRNVKMPFALAIQVLLAQIGMPALEYDCEKAQLIFFAQLRHTMSILQLQLRLDNRSN